MRVIKGYANTHLVYIDDKVLSPTKSLKVFPHSPTGFSWGYQGSGPAQLALAILLLYCPENQAVKLHQDFTRDIIANFKMDEDFAMSDNIVKHWLLKKEG